MQDDDGEPRALGMTNLITLSLVASHGSFTRAAEALGVSQPSVSQQIRDLERSVGLPVVQQKGRSIAVTPVGLELAEIGRRIALERERASRVASRHRDGHLGRLTLGASMTTGAHVIPKIIARLHAERPDAIMELRIGNTFDVAEMVTNDIVDIGIIEGKIDRGELLVIPFASDRVICIAQARFDAPDEMLTPDDVRTSTLLVREDGSGTRQVVEEALSLQGFSFAQTLLFGTNQTITAAVIHGLGIAWVPQISVERELASGYVRELRFTTPPITREFSIIRRRDTMPTPLGEALIAMLRAPKHES